MCFVFVCLYLCSCVCVFMLVCICVFLYVCLFDCLFYYSNFILFTLFGSMVPPVTGYVN